MENTYKLVPFDIELVKKIQSGEIEGRIMKKELYPDMFPVRFICFNSKVKGYPYIALEYNPFCNSESIAYYENEDVCKRELIIELPEEAPKREFKPFDKVLVRVNEINAKWIPRLFAYSDRDLYFCQDDFGYRFCIPYEGNEHLVGTTNNPK